MTLEQKVKMVLNNNDIYEGDTFICKRTSSAPVGRRYKYQNGKITSMNDFDIKPTTVKNLIRYYIFIKES